MDRAEPANETGGNFAQRASAAFADQMGAASSSSDEEGDAMAVTMPDGHAGVRPSEITAASESECEDDDASDSEEEEEASEAGDVRASAARLLRQVSLAQKKRGAHVGDLESSIQALLEVHSSGSESTPHLSNRSNVAGEDVNIRENAERLLRQVSLAQHRRRGTDAGGDLESSISVLLEVHASMHTKDSGGREKKLKLGPSLPMIQDEEEEEERELRESRGREYDGVRADAARLLRQASPKKGRGSDVGGLESSIKALLVAHKSERDNGTAQAANDFGGNAATEEPSDDAGVRAGAERLLRRVQSRGGNPDDEDLGSSLRALLEVHKSMRDRRSKLGQEFGYETDLGRMLSAVREANERLRASLWETGDVGFYYDQILQLKAGKGDAYLSSLKVDMDRAVCERREAAWALDALQQEAVTLRQTLEETEGRTPRRQFFKGS